MSDIIFTDEFIQKMHELADKAQPRPWVCEWNWHSLDLGDNYIGWAESPEIQTKSLSGVSQQATADKDYMEASVNNYMAAMDKIIDLQAEVNWLSSIILEAEFSIYQKYCPICGNDKNTGHHGNCIFSSWRNREYE